MPCNCPRCKLIAESVGDSHAIHKILDGLGYRNCKYRLDWWDWPYLVLIPAIPAHWLN